MLYHLLFPLAGVFEPFNLFRYQTFRSMGAVVTALIICFIAGPRVIQWLKSKQAEGQPIRIDGPEGHLLRKKGTPTMGGFLILLAITVSTLAWADLTNGYVWVALLVTAGFGGIVPGEPETSIVPVLPKDPAVPPVTVVATSLTAPPLPAPPPGLPKAACPPDPPRARIFPVNVIVAEEAMTIAPPPPPPPPPVLPNVAPAPPPPEPPIGGTSIGVP